jgi:hypothetical protein
MSTANATTPPARMVELAARALLGTDRAGGGDAAPGKLLREAAILGTRARAGSKPAQTRSSMPECPADDVPVVSPACAATLRRIATDGDGAMIEEWAELAAARARRVPDALVPGLLEWWTNQPRGSQAVRKVMGVRAEWLCSLNPAWRKKPGVGTLPADVEGAWQTGSIPDRLGLLMTVRHLEPATAERLLRATWAQDAADERKRFVEKYEIGLSMADEPFLEWTLDDRSKQVREAASGLLARLPASRLAGRMLDRAAAMFAVEQGKKGILRRAADKVVVEPPKEWDAAWERDGLEEKPPGAVGKRAWWMQQVISRTAPGALAQRAGLPPERLLEAVGESDYAKPGLAGLGAAAAALKDESWCVLLVRHHLADKKTTPEEIEPIWRALGPAAREAILIEVIRKGPFDWAQRLAVVSAADHRWSIGFTGEVLNLLGKDKPSGEQQVWAVYPHLEKFTRWMHPGGGGVAALEKFVAAVFKDALPPSAIKAIDRVRLRAEMHKEFES